MFFVSFLTKKIESVSSHFPYLTGIYRWYYEKIVDDEIILGKISEEDRVLIIGGGPFPCTAIQIANKTNANIHIIDKDPIAVDLASDLIKKLSLDNQIHITCTRGQEVDTSEYSVIHIAQQVSPKEAVLSNLLKKTKIGTRILLRSKEKGLDNFYKKQGSISNIIKYKDIKQGKFTGKRTFLITKLESKSDSKINNIDKNLIQNNRPNRLKDIKAY